MALRRCVFCGDPAKSIEDAIPRWLLKHHRHLYGGGTVKRRWGALDDPLRVRVGEWDGLAITVRSVCAPCNNGWLSLLETEALTLLRPIMSGLAVTLHNSDQRTLAFWAVKTAITIQEANRSLALPIPSEHVASVYQERLAKPHTLPNHFTVWFARHKGPSVGFAYLVEYSRDPTAPFKPLPPSAEHRYWVSFRIGNFAFHILGHTMPSHAVASRANPQSLFQVWPPSVQAQVWPPVIGFDDHGFETIARTTLPGATWSRGGIVMPRRTY